MDVYFCGSAVLGKDVQKNAIQHKFNFAKEYFKDNGQADKIVAKKMEDSTKRKEAEIENDCQLEDEDNLIDN